MRATASSNGITVGASTIASLFPQQQIGLVALGVMNRGGAIRHRVAAAMASKVVTPISGFFSATRKPAHEGEADALAGEGARPGGDGKPVQRGEGDARLPHRLVHHRRQRFGMAARHLLEAMGQNVLAVQHRDRTGAQRRIDRQNRSRERS